jgi:hypothetical protein
MKYLSQYFVVLALAFGAMAVTSIDVHAATVCGPNGCRHVYTHRGQWPVGQGGGYYNTAQRYYGHYKHRSRWPVGQ